MAGTASTAAQRADGITPIPCYQTLEAARFLIMALACRRIQPGVVRRIYERFLRCVVRRAITKAH